MKKFLKRIMIVVFMLVLGYKQYSYADMIAYSETEEKMMNIEASALLLLFIGVIILFISIISFLILKVISKKDVINETKNNRKLNIGKGIIYFSIIVIVISVIGYIYATYYGEISIKLLWIPIILIIISIIIRLFKNKKISNIICGIAIISVFICPAYQKSIENYNEQFAQYLHEWKDTRYVLDIEKLIKATIENNETNNRKVSIIYEDLNYSSGDELKLLLDEVDTIKIYGYSILKDEIGYIQSITLTWPGHPYYATRNKNFETFYEFVYYYCDNNAMSATETADIMYKCIKIHNKELENFEINIIYNSDSNQNTIINVNEQNRKQILDLRKEIKESNKTYTVDVHTKSNICNVYITANE